MSEPPIEPGPVSEEPQPPVDPPAAELPGWVPIFIGVVLVVMGGLAVYTGLRYRNNASLVNGIIKPRHQAPPATGGGPPGEPEPGGSLVFPGDDNVPVAGPAATGHARAVITGGGKSINTTVRFWARRGMVFHVTPEDAVVTVNNLAVGAAKQFSGEEKVYEFPAAGSFNVTLSAPGFRTATYVVTAAPDAKQELATIDAALQKQ